MYFNYNVKMVIIASFVVLPLLLLNQASINDAQVENAIVNGTEASPGQFPNIVAIQVNGSIYCAGSIISTTWILTSGRCLSNTTAANYQIFAGTNTLDSGVRRNISQIIIHPDYVPIYTNGIGLARLDRPLIPCSRIRTATLTNVDTPEGTLVTVSGWGSTSDAENSINVPSNTLLTFNTTTTSNANCQTAMNLTIPPGDLCAFSSVGQGVCRMDDGDPLIDTNTRQQVGIAAAAILCARGYPDIYTRVFSYRDWIANNTGITL